MRSMIQKRRFSFPHPNLADAQLEPIVQPLYSAAIIESGVDLPQELFFFRYAVGGTVSGLAGAAGTTVASVLHTNMDTPGFIASPKVFLITGVRLLIPNIDSVFTAPKDDSATAAEFPTPHSITDTMEIFYGTYFRLFIGTKDYLTVPTWAIPGNTGVGGMAAGNISVAAAAGPFESQVVSANTSGRYFGLGEHRILLPSQQNFFASLNAPQPDPPQTAAEAAVVAVLDGVLGREVQ